MNRYNEKISEQVNDWFYQCSDIINPAHTVCDIAGFFAQQIENEGYRLCLPFKDFRERICEATCTMYKAYIESKRIACPSRIINPPKNWNKEIEFIWEDYISTFLTHDDFWSNFWHNIPQGIWESQFSEYRIFIQSILPSYIQRDYELL